MPAIGVQIAVDDEGEVLARSNHVFAGYWEQPEETAKALADAFTASTGNQWVQSIGSTYSLFEVAREAFTAASDPHDKAEVAKAFHNVSYTGMCGPINFAGGPAPGVGIIKPVGDPFEMVVVDNSLNKNVPIGGALEPTNA